jgi:hypothetical protein
MFAMDSRSFDWLRTGSAGMTKKAATQGRPYNLLSVCIGVDLWLQRFLVTNLLGHAPRSGRGQALRPYLRCKWFPLLFNGFLHNLCNPRNPWSNFLLLLCNSAAISAMWF